MKTKLHLLTVLAAACGLSLASAQDERPPAPPRSGDETRPPAPARPLLRPAAFLGIATSPLPPVLTAQLGLPDGFGLVVDEVVPDSPAGKAGVQRFDVLRQFNDQYLVDPNQLATLVRAQAKDAEVSLILLRKGQEQKVTVKISERPMPVGLHFPAPTGEIREQLERLKGDADDKARKVREQMREFQDRMKEHEERLKKGQARPEGELPKPPELRPSVEPGDRPDGARPERRLEQRRALTANTANAKVLMKDDSGEIEVTSSDGRRKLVAKNAKGEVVFDGPIDTPGQINALPEDLRKKVETIEVRTKIEPNDPGDMFVSAYTKIKSAEKLAAKGSMPEAIRAYKEAEDILKTIREQYPRWQEQIVEHRKRSVADALEKLAPQSEAPRKP